MTSSSLSQALPSSKEVIGVFSISSIVLIPEPATSLAHSIVPLIECSGVLFPAATSLHIHRVPPIRTTPHYVRRA